MFFLTTCHPFPKDAPLKFKFKLVAIFFFNLVLTHVFQAMSVKTFVEKRSLDSESYLMQANQDIFLGKF